MNKNEILEKSRNENKNADPYEMEINAKAGSYGVIAALILCFILFLIQIFAGHGLNYGLWAICSILNAAASCYKAAKLKTKNLTFIAVSYSIMSVLLIAAAIIQIIKMG